MIKVSVSPLLSDHAGHFIREQALTNALRRTVPGNGWCYTCRVPVEANWSDGLKPVTDPGKPR